jgi:uroporphyrin-3 C-methyltransferase
LLNARLALMARHGEVVRSDLQAVKNLLERYFRLDAPQVIQAVQEISRVLEQVNDTEVPRADETLAALSKAAGGQ